MLMKMIKRITPPVIVKYLRYLLMDYYASIYYKQDRIRYKCFSGLKYKNNTEIKILSNISQ